MNSSVSAAEKLSNTFCASRIIAVFNTCFNDTRLIGGADEPLYEPAIGNGGFNRLYFRQDYFASALHEISHWCIAGAGRRKQLDFGYWYAPDGRNLTQQADFEAVEYKPQALEWYFSKACNYRFQVSVDNLNPDNGKLPESAHFKQRVLEQALVWLEQGLPQRAGEFYAALAEEFSTCNSPDELNFTLAELS